MTPCGASLRAFASRRLRLTSCTGTRTLRAISTMSATISLADSPREVGRDPDLLHLALARRSAARAPPGGPRPARRRASSPACVAPRPARVMRPVRPAPRDANCRDERARTHRDAFAPPTLLRPRPAAPRPCRARDRRPPARCDPSALLLSAAAAPRRPPAPLACRPAIGTTPS